MLPPIPTRTELATPLAHILWAWNIAIGKIPFGPRDPLLAFIYHWLNRTVGRFDRLVMRWQAGTLPKPRPSQEAKERAAKPPAAPPEKPKLRLPSGKHWLATLVPATARQHDFLAALLANPDTIRLVQEAPQAGRLLRPLCRAIGLAIPDYLALPPRPEKPRAPRPPRPPRPTLPPMRPLPAYVRAAVRAWKPRFG